MSEFGLPSDHHGGAVAEPFHQLTEAINPKDSCACCLVICEIGPWVALLKERARQLGETSKRAVAQK